MKIFSILSLFCAASLQAQVIYSDNFDDNTNTGWTYLNRNGDTEVGDAVWAETGGRLEQQTETYDFPRDTTVDDPVLGAIALAPTVVGGYYSITADFISLEPGNGFQDQDFVFGYQDADNFFIVEMIASSGLNLYSVIGGERSQIAGTGLSFSHSLTNVVMEHNAFSGDFSLTYGGGAPVNFSDASLVMGGTGAVGVGSNNDAFAIDNFVITQIPEPGVFGLLGIAAVCLLRRRRK